MLAGYWVLLIIVWRSQSCSSIAHMHIKLLHELNTCVWICSSSCCLKLPVSDTNSTHLSVSLPSLPLFPASVWWQMVQIWYVCQPSPSSEPLGGIYWWGCYGFHTPLGLLSIRRDCLWFCSRRLFNKAAPVTGRFVFISAHFLLTFYQLRLLSSLPSFDWPYLGLFNNKPLFAFILPVMVRSSIIALLLSVIYQASLFLCIFHARVLSA